MEGKLIVLGSKETETLFSDCDETFFFFFLPYLLNFEGTPGITCDLPMLLNFP